jgi:hypothetical protein
MEIVLNRRLAPGGPKIRVRRKAGQGVAEPGLGNSCEPFLSGATEDEIEFLRLRFAEAADRAHHTRSA